MERHAGRRLALSTLT
jgi:hypothetical protein